MNRRTWVVVAAGAVAGSALMGKENTSMREILEASQNEKKSVMLYLKGQSIGGVVVKMGSEIVELRNREYSRIVIRIDAIDAAAMS
jgi:hypothetical protein